MGQKKRKAIDCSSNSDLQKENEDLRLIIRKLLNNEPLEESDNRILERLSIRKSEDDAI